MIASPQLSSVFEDVSVFHHLCSVAMYQASSTVEHVVQRGPTESVSWAMVTCLWLRISCFLSPLNAELLLYKSDTNVVEPSTYKVLCK